MQEIFALESRQMNYVKSWTWLTTGKKATVFTETLGHTLNITF